MRKLIEERTAKFAKEISALCETIRNRPNGRTPADQLLDCATSAAANYRAAGRGRTRKEFVSKLGIANEEADEAVYWLDHIANTAVGAALDLTALHKEACELRAIIARSYATARVNSQRRTPLSPKQPPREDV
jgi:four helix bundle protein